MMELLGNKHNPHTRPLPGRWTPFQNLMARCHLPCTKCSTDTISLTSEVQYDGLLEGSSTPHTSRGYHADVSNLSSGSDDRRVDTTRPNVTTRQESVITDSDLPSNRSNNHLGLVFSPGRRAQLSRQQLSWMQALSKDNINTPPSLRDAQFLQNPSDVPERRPSNDSSHSPQSDISALPDSRTCPPQSPGSNFSVEQTRVAITQHLLTDPSSDENEQSPLQSTIVDVYSLQNENTMFNFDERNRRNSGSVHSPQSSTESFNFNFSDSNLSVHNRSEEQTTSPNEAADDNRDAVFPDRGWQSAQSDECLARNENNTPNSGQARNSISGSDVENFRSDIWSEDTTCNDSNQTVDRSNATDETTVGTSQESAEETVLLDYSENFTFNPISSQVNAHTLPPENSHNYVPQPEVDNVRQAEVTDSQENEANSRHIGSQSNSDSSSERNLPVHLISLFENPLSSSDAGSTAHSHSTQNTNNSGRVGAPNSTDIPPTNETSFSQPFPRFNHAVVNTNNQDRWATRIIRSNLTNSQQSSNSNTQTVRSNSSGGSNARPQLQNWYVYDPRLVPGNRPIPRLNLEMQYRGVQQLWSMPAIIGPPDYDDLSTLQSDNGDTNDVMRPSEPPPPYMEGSVPPPTYDEAIFDSLFADDELLGLESPVYVDPSPPPTISDINARVSSNLTIPPTLPSEVLQQLENVLNMNSSSPFQSPGDTLTSCATQQSDSLCGDLGENISNGTSSMQRPSQRSPNVRNRISSISTYFPDSREGSGRNSYAHFQATDHSVPLQSLRSALSAHMQTLNHNAPTMVRPPSNRISQSHQPSRTSTHHHHHHPHHHRDSHGSAHIENYFNRPAIMWNRSVWSESHSRNNFGLGNRLSTYNSSPDVSQVH